ncbi:SapC family protein [uncultured Bartonella sp.]|uniref:SapC family protein n=1 Tax=uncultured Bartonella sp. TaxID=104108 RepID=UPI00261ADE0E|nr:SapC family protein [uncultured Bartonella sp.]
MTTVMLFYKNIVPISRETHKKLKFSAPANAAFAANTHWVPLAGEEFYLAALSYPILFMGNETPDGKIGYTAVALLGLANNENDYLDHDNKWRADTYIPAFVRRYPFVLAGTPDQKELTVCFDSDSGMFNEVEGIDLFNSDDSVSPFLENRINFLNNFKTGMEQTEKFLETIEKMGLLKKQSIDIRAQTGQSARLENFWMIDTEKLDKLPGDQLAKLNKRGFLGWIFAQLMSMNNLTNLMALHLAHKKNANGLENKDKAPLPHNIN